MENAIKKKRIAFIVSLVSFVFALALSFVSIKCIKEPLYIFMAISAVFAVVFYYLAVFMFFAFLDARAIIELLEIVNYAKVRRVQLSITDISAQMGWRTETTAKFIEKCRKKGYMR